jgi:hypothetical protein
MWPRLGCSLVDLTASGLRFRTGHSHVRGRLHAFSGPFSHLQPSFAVLLTLTKAPLSREGFTQFLSSALIPWSSSSPPSSHSSVSSFSNLSPYLFVPRLKGLSSMYPSLIYDLPHYTVSMKSQPLISSQLERTTVSFFFGMAGEYAPFDPGSSRRNIPFICHAPASVISSH